MQTATVVACGAVAPKPHVSCYNSRGLWREAFLSRPPKRAINYHKHASQRARCLIATGGSDSDEDEPSQQPSTSGFSASQSSRGLGLNADLERPVPDDQRPVNELAALRETWLYSWVSLTVC